MKNIYAMLPCFNEALNIGELIDEWMKQKDSLKEDFGYNLQIYAIDDCSTDNTKEVIISKTKEYPENVHLIAHEVNKNLCGGLNTSIDFFINNGDETDLMCLMDGDNTHNPKYILNMVRKMERKNVDCVIASRYCSGADVVGLAWHRKMMSDFAKIYYSIILKVPNVKDYTCGYRLYKYDAIENLVKKFGQDPIKEMSFACMMELLYKLYIAGATFGEVGFELRYDKKMGESKMNVKSTMTKSLGMALKLRKLKKKG